MKFAILPASLVSGIIVYNDVPENQNGCFDTVGAALNYGELEFGVENPNWRIVLFKEPKETINN